MCQLVSLYFVSHLLSVIHRTKVCVKHCLIWATFYLLSNKRAVKPPYYMNQTLLIKQHTLCNTWGNLTCFLLYSSSWVRLSNAHKAPVALTAVPITAIPPPAMHRYSSAGDQQKKGAKKNKDCSASNPLLEQTACSSSVAYTMYGSYFFLLVCRPLLRKHADSSTVTYTVRHLCYLIPL